MKSSGSKKTSIQILCKINNICNANCFYCFDKNNQSKKQKLDLNQLYRFADKLFSQTKYVDWIWHGGEPTCIDISEFETIIQNIFILALKYDCWVNFSIQTNGINFDERWFNLCNKYAIATGLSNDGPTNQLSRGYDLFNYDSFMNQVVVLNKYNINNLAQVYQQCKNNNMDLAINFPFSTDTITYSDIIGCSDEECINKYLDFILNTYLYDLEGITETTANSLILMSLGKTPGVCYMYSCLKPECGIYCINSDNSLYLCDNICEEFKVCDLKDFEHLTATDRNSINKYNPKNQDKCKYCKYDCICSGGCPHRYMQEGNNEFYCKLIKIVIPVLYDKLNDLKPEEFIKLNRRIRTLLIENHYIPSSLKEKINAR